MSSERTPGSGLSRDPLPRIADRLRTGELSARELLRRAFRNEGEREPDRSPYKLRDPDGARMAAEQADLKLSGDPSEGSRLSDPRHPAAGDPAGPEGDLPAPGPLCGVPVSVKDLYGVEGLPTFAGTRRTLPERWSREGWLVERLRRQGAVVTGKTHTVELAYGAVGINPHWGTPWNPWDPEAHRIPGGSSSGAGVSLVEGSALVALGSDTGGSIRIPASMTGTVGLRTTTGRWPTGGVVPLSSTLDVVGALTRSVVDQAWFFGAVDPAWGDPRELLKRFPERGAGEIRVGVPRCDIWDACQPDLRAVLTDALETLSGAGWRIEDIEGGLLDRAADLYLQGSLAGAECRAFLEAELPGWLEILHPTVGERLADAPSLESERYAAARSDQDRLAGSVEELFDGIDLLALPGHLLTPPRVAELEALERYLEVNTLALRPTAPASILGLPALTLPVGLDQEEMPVGLQLLAPPGQDERVLALGIEAEGEIGGMPVAPPARRSD